MDDELHPAAPEDILETLSMALRFNDQGHVFSSHQFMADITAKHLVEQLDRRGFIMMQRQQAARCDFCEGD